MDESVWSPYDKEWSEEERLLQREVEFDEAYARANSYLKSK
jgi:hypothetical protein